MPTSLRLAYIMRPADNSFGVIRLAMALAVLISHSFLFVTGRTSAEPLYAWTGHTLGEHAVQVFFFLSGIMVTESLLRSRGTLEFATARVLRIFPGLVVCVVLTALALGPVVSALPLPEYLGNIALPRYVAASIFLVTGSAPLPGTFEHLPAAGLVNMSLWTLKYEVMCYAGLALLGITGLLHSASGRSIAATVIAVALLAALPAPSDTGAYTTAENVRYFALFFGLGTIAALMKRHIIIDGRITVGLGALYALLIGTPWAELGCALFVASVALWASTFEFGPLRAWTNRHDISFGVYIYAAPLQQAILQAAPGLDPINLSLAALAPATLLAAASWLMIEKPALARKATAGAVLASWLPRFSAPVSIAARAPAPTRKELR